jgi:PAS domain S-box-containing protein
MAGTVIHHAPLDQMTKESETLSKSEANAGQAALRQSLRAQWQMLATALVLLAAVLVYHGFAVRRDISRQEQSRLKTQARVIALNIGNQLHATNLALGSIINDMPYLRRHESIKLTNRRLQALMEAMTGIRSIFVFDAKGNIVASNRAVLIGRNFRTRDYFTIPAKDNNPSVLYLSSPFKTVLGSFLINVSRVITSPDGSFNGIVTAALDPAYFQVLLNSVLYEPDMWSSINHGDGIRFIVVPEQTGQTVKNLALPGTFFTRHRESGRIESVLIGKSVSYPAERLMALHTVQPQTVRLNKALIVTCSRDHAAIFDNWRTGVLKQGMAFILISSAACFGLVLLQRRQRAMASLIMREQEELHKLNASLRESQQLLADIYDFLPDATFVVDLEKKVIAWNRSVAEMTGITKEEMLGQGDHAYTIPFYGVRRDVLLDLIDTDDDELRAKYQGVTRRGDRLYGEAFCPALYNGRGAHI